MKALVIGATGIIGNHVVRSLLKDGVEVRALSRGITPSVNLEGLKVERFTGDVNNPDSLSKAAKDCEWVFHTAPYYPTNTFNLNGHINEAIKGLKSVLDVVEKSKQLKKFVYTSSLTTIGIPTKKREANEKDEYNLKTPPHPYFAVKYLMEEEVKKRALAGLPAVIVNPTGCFGPFELKPPNFCLVPQLINRQVPGYLDRPMNAVDVADVGLGHVLAAKKGKIAQRYILGGHNVSSAWIIKTICALGHVSPPKLKIPLPFAIAIAYFSEIMGAMMKRTPSIPLVGLRFIQYGQHMSSDLAIKELGYQISPMEPCFERAIEWFRKIKYIKS